MTRKEIQASFNNEEKDAKHLAPETYKMFYISWLEDRIIKQSRILSKVITEANKIKKQDDT